MSVSPGALPRLRPRPGNLREIAEVIEGGSSGRAQVVVSPARRGKHVGVVYGVSPRGPQPQGGPFTERSK